MRRRLTLAILLLWGVACGSLEGSYGPTEIRAQLLQAHGEQPVPGFPRDFAALAGGTLAIQHPAGRLPGEHPQPEAGRSGGGEADLLAAVRRAAGRIERAASRSPDVATLVSLGELAWTLSREPVELEPAERRGYEQLALALFTRAAEREPGAREAWWGLLILQPVEDPRATEANDGNLVADWEQARRVCERYLELEPANALARLQLARAHIELGQPERALPLLHALLSEGVLEGVGDQRMLALSLRVKAAEQLGQLDQLDGVTQAVERELHSLSATERYYPGCPYQVLGLLYQGSGRASSADEAFRMAAVADTRLGWEALGRALDAFEAGEYGDSEQILARVVVGFPLHCVDPDPCLEVQARVRSLHALSLATQRRWAEARASLDLAEQERAGLAFPLVVRGHLALGRKEPSAARSRFLEALDALGPSSAAVEDPLELQQQRLDVLGRRMALLGLGWLEANATRFEAATDWYGQALDLAPDDPLLRQSQAVALIGLGRMDEAQSLLEGILELRPDDPYALSELGIIHLNRGELAQARQVFEHAAETAPPRYSCPWEGLGLVMLREGATEQAEGALAKAIELNPGVEYKKYNALARIRIEQGRLDEARTLLRSSIQNHPYDEEARELLEELTAQE